MRIGDDRRQQMRNAVVNRQLQHLRIDHQQAAVVGRMTIKQRQHHCVDADRLARTRRSRDEQMRHAREIGDHRLAANGFAKPDRQRQRVGFERIGFEDLAQQNGFAPRVRQFEPDRIASGNHGGAHARETHRTRDVFRKPDDARRLRSARRLELVQRHDRARPNILDLAFDAEVGEHVFQQPRVAAHDRLRKLGIWFRRGRTLEHVERRPLPLRGRAIFETAEQTTSGLRSRHRLRRGWLHDRRLGSGYWRRRRGRRNAALRGRRSKARRNCTA